MESDESDRALVGRSRGRSAGGLRVAPVAPAVSDVGTESE